MKTTILSFTFLLVTIVAKAQDNYQTEMRKNIDQLDTINNVNSINGSISFFTAAYGLKNDWHALYEECFAYIKLSKAVKSDEDKKAALQTAANLLDKLPEQNDEIQVLKAYYAMNYLTVDHTEWQTYLPMLQEALQKAETLNPDNPRVYFLSGIMKYNMPAAMGGGHDEGLTILKKAKEKFSTYQPADGLAPGWGRREVLQYTGN
jgi:hypothetical protein